MNQDFEARVQAELDEIRTAGLWKEERIIVSPQGADIRTSRGPVVNFCANNYLGLANHPRLVAAAERGLKERGLGLASVRFICGTQDKHKELEAALAKFLGFEECILYTSCFDANGGVFETLMKEQDVIISDELNHASIIDGIRLSKAERLRYKRGDMAELETHLKATQDKRTRMIATDGVFSMDGDIADLKTICDLAERYRAIVMVDDSHATGFVGKTGRGTPEFHGVAGRIDVMTSTLGKALGGASGGFTLGSNTLPPALVGASLECVAMLSESTALRDRLEANTARFRRAMTAAGFAIRPGVHPICPIMLGDAKVAQEMARRMLDEGVYVIGFSFPVVPKGLARIRVQISAAHTFEQIDHAVAAFTKVKRDMGI
jgi:glycine C-acetyltransferase